MIRETKTVQVFHGTTCCFKIVDLQKADGCRDFGAGFYMTTLADVAESWARAKENGLVRVLVKQL